MAQMCPPRCGAAQILGLLRHQVLGLPDRVIGWPLGVREFNSRLLFSGKDAPAEQIVGCREFGMATGALFQRHGEGVFCLLLVDSGRTKGGN